MTSSPPTKYITEPEVVFEEHEVNEDIRPMTAFESDKEIGNVPSLLTIALYLSGLLRLFMASLYVQLVRCRTGGLS
jgi:hypothetical protein